MRYGDRVRGAVPSVVATFLGLALAAVPRVSAETGKRAAPADKSEHELPVPVMFGRVSPSVVIVAASLGSEGKQGSGVVIEAGKVVTNAHVVSGMRSDDDHFRLMMVRGVNFHGQPRARASSGPCEPVEPVGAKRANFGERPEASCRRGEIDGCVAAALAVEPQNKLSALTLYLRGCELGSPGERAARRDVAAKSCREAARLCDALGYGARAAELREKTRRLAGADNAE